MFSNNNYIIITINNNYDDGSDDDDDIDNDIGLSPEKQQWRIKLRSIRMMSLGTFLVILFSSPMVSALMEISKMMIMIVMIVVIMIVIMIMMMIVVMI